MNILWITNVELPAIANYFGRDIVVGGWMDTTSSLLSKEKEINLFIVSDAKAFSYEDVVVDGIHYWGFDKTNSEEIIDRAIATSKPDVVHIWGTEGKHIEVVIDMLKKTKKINRTIISIQGLTSEICKHYCDGLPLSVANKCIRIGRIKRTSIKNEMKEMRRQGELEKRVLSNVKHCIGRTEWDYRCVLKSNPDIHYYHVNESLRTTFYKADWQYEKCMKNTIFFSQSHYPIKGLHIMLKALSIVKREIPDVKLRVLGTNPKEENDGRLKSYSDYLANLIDKENLGDCIKWIGKLSAEEMKHEYLLANLFVCASTIENSSNSVCEAMLVGTPIVATNVGGMQSLFEKEEWCKDLVCDCNVDELARQIICTLEMNDAIYRKCSELKNIASKRHDLLKNNNELIKVYCELLRECD